MVAGGWCSPSRGGQRWHQLQIYRAVAVSDDGGGQKGDRESRGKPRGPCSLGLHVEMRGAECEARVAFYGQGGSM
jgi:hypothetical protein